MYIITKLYDSLKCNTRNAIDFIKRSYLNGNGPNKKFLKEIIDELPEELKNMNLHYSITFPNVHTTTLTYYYPDSKSITGYILNYINELGNTNLVSSSELEMILYRLKDGNSSGLDILEELCPVYFEIFNKRILHPLGCNKLPYMTIHLNANINIPLNQTNFKDFFPEEV